MSQQLGTPSPSYASLSAWETWLAALTRPSVATFEIIANDVNATLSRALIWVASAALIQSIVGIVLQYVFYGGPRIPQTGSLRGVDTAALTNISQGLLLCLVPVSVVAAVIGFIIGTGIIHLIAKSLGGTGTFEKFAFTTAAISAPIGLIAIILNAIPFGACLSIPIGIYALVLNIMAIKAVHQFAWERAIVAYVIVPIILVCIIAVFVALILGSMGPSVGNVFSNVLRSL